MAESGRQAVKIFVPQQCLTETSGILLGFHQSSTIIVTAITLEAEYIDEWKEICPDIEIVGEWDNEVLMPAEKVCDIPYDELLFSLRKVDSDPPLCRLLQKGRYYHGEFEPMILLYNPDNITESQYLRENEVTNTQEAQTNLQCIMKHVMKYKTSFSNQQDELLTSFVRLDSDSFKATRIIKQLTFNVFALFLSLLHWFFTSILFTNRVSSMMLSLPAIVLQLKYRFSDLKRCLQLKPLSRNNVLIRHVFDVLLGVALMYVFVTNNGSSLLAKWLMMWAHNVASQLQELITWLMGVPAGLKLNSQLDMFLGKFYIYHIYLWTGYLSFLGPVLSSALWIVSLFGCLGLSAQLAIAQDLLSMLTLHIYCFYVYAARLYSLQFQALCSLWRLFRGKKWNVLRKRVDSAQYDVDQLFIGTLLFTVLLFLLPTTLLYYVVFTTLRLVVLSLQGLIHQLIHLINKSPLYILILRIFGPETLASEPRFQVMARNAARPLYFTLELHPPPLSELLHYDSHSTAPSKYTWKTFWHHLLTGQLIYPWIDPEKS